MTTEKAEAALSVNDERDTHDYYNEVLAYAESLNKSANDEWERAILDGCPRPLTADGVREIAEWIVNEAPDAWGKTEENEVLDLRAIASELKAIADKQENAEAA